MSEFEARVRIRFAKQGSARFLSHHDVMRVFERALRRASLPVKMTEGYHPHMKMSFAIALGVGISGLEEVAEIQFTQMVPARRLEEALQAGFPDGLSVSQIDLVAPRAMARVQEIQYQVHFPEGPDQSRLDQLLSQEVLEVERIRKKKKVKRDIRSLIISLERDAEFLKMRFHVNDGVTSRPEEILACLGYTLDEARALEIVRNRVILSDEVSQRSPEEDLNLSHVRH